MLSWLFGKKSRLNAVESCVIDELINALPSEAGKILRSQTKLINKVQRLDQDREVDFYHMVNGRADFPEDALFPNRTEELELAKVRLTDPDSGHGTTGVVFLVKGHIFSIEFKLSPRDLRNARNLRVEVQILGDPMLKT
jgi:hypothetical protein